MFPTTQVHPACCSSSSPLAMCLQAAAANRRLAPLARATDDDLQESQPASQPHLDESRGSRNLPAAVPDI